MVLEEVPNVNIHPLKSVCQVADQLKLDSFLLQLLDLGYFFLLKFRIQSCLNESE
jgi:hypothetical protein